MVDRKSDDARVGSSERLEDVRGVKPTNPMHFV